MTRDGKPAVFELQPDLSDGRLVAQFGPHWAICTTCGWHSATFPMNDPEFDRVMRQHADLVHDGRESDRPD
jgi:hypothetical protein